MRTSILKLSLLIGLTIALGLSVSGQTQSSITAKGSTAGGTTPADITAKDNTVKVDQTIAFLLDQNEKARQLIAAQEKRIADLETETAAERENGESLSKSYAAAQKEIDSLRSANEALHKAVSLNEQTINLIQSDRDKWKDKAHKATRDKYIAYAVTAGLIVLKFVLPF